MTDISRQFVVATQEIDAPQESVVEKNDVGVITSENESGSSVFFIRIWKKIELDKNNFKMLDVRRTGDRFSKKICNVCNKLI